MFFGSPLSCNPGHHSNWIFNIDAQDAQDLDLGARRLGSLGNRKPAPDHRPSWLLVQETFMLSILCILCIHVHKKY